MITEYSIKFLGDNGEYKGMATHDEIFKTIKINLLFTIKTNLSSKRRLDCCDKDIDLTDVNMGFVEFAGDFDQIATYEICATYKNINVVVKANIENGCIALKSATEEGYALELLSNFEAINMIKREILPQILTQYINNLGADYG